MRVNRIRNARLLQGFACPQRLRCGENGILNRGIARTTAERIFQCKTNLIAGGVWIPLEQRVGGHDLARDAESALHCAMFDKSFLQRMKLRAPERTSGRCERSDRRRRSV